jgi:hypothetical protein
MATIAVLCDPPRAGLVLADLAARTPLSPAEAATLYGAALGDVLAAAEASGSDLLVNYRPDDALPDGRAGDTEDDASDPDADGDEASAENEVRAIAREALDEPGAARYEVQVGSTRAARVGNTVTHLLESEGETSVALAEPTAPFLSRGDLDGAAMKLRRSPVVLGPATRGRVYYAGFTDPVDFADADTTRALGSLTERAVAAGHEVDYLSMSPLLETRADLVTALALLDARQRAGRAIPARTAAALDEFGLRLDARDGELELTRGETDRA